MRPDSILNIPNWIIEVEKIDMTGKYRVVHQFKSNFKSPPNVTATAYGPDGRPTGNANVHVVSVTKKEIDMSVNASIPGMYIQIHAFGKN